MIGESFQVNHKLSTLEESAQYAIDSITADNKFHFGTFVFDVTFIAIVKKYITDEYAVAVFFAYMVDGYYYIRKAGFFWEPIRRLDS